MTGKPHLQDRPSTADGMNADDAAFAESLRTLLREDEQDLDFVTASRLSAARARAVAASARPVHPLWRWTLAGVPSAAALLVAAWLVVPGLHGGRTHAGSGVPIEVIEQLGGDTALQSSEDEIDFAQWLDESGNEAAPASGGST